MLEYDELKLYRAKEKIPINSKISIRVPTIGEIEEFGEKDYFSSIHTLVAVGADFKWQLADNGIDYTKISDYDLFIKLIWKSLSSQRKAIEQINQNPEIKQEIENYTDDEIKKLCRNPLELILGDIDLADFDIYKDENDNVILFDKVKDIAIDKVAYFKIVDYIRKTHGLKRNNEKPANEKTKKDLIEDARDAYMMNKSKPFKSVLFPIVSALVNCPEFKYRWDDVWGVPINVIFDSLKRISKIQETRLLLQGAYSGFADLKAVDKDKLNWVGDID